MKYKNINSMLHNFGHSFCSLMNFVDNQYIVDIIQAILADSVKKFVTIEFPSGKIEGISSIPEAFKKSILIHCRWLPQHAESHGVDIEKVLNLRMTIHRPSELSISPCYSFECEVSCIDDLGRKYFQKVNLQSS